MRWKKVGKIFDPGDHRIAVGSGIFAQSPQTLVFDDFVRIYFSTRERDSNGKYLSHIAFIDMDKEFKSVLRSSVTQVIPLGNPGCFDEHGIFPMNVLRIGDKVYAYTGGWNRRVSVSVDTSIGLAISEDNGLTFTKTGEGPVLSASLNEPFLVGDPFVGAFEKRLHMWYIYGLRWIKFGSDGMAERVYKIAHSVSDDGIEWVRDGRQIIEDRIDENECQAMPTVIHIGDLYHMLFCYRHHDDFRTNSNKGYRLGYAFSADLVNWTRDDSKSGIDVSADGWDSEMQCYPHLFRCDDKICLLYNGNEFGRNGFGLAIMEHD